MRMWEHRREFPSPLSCLLTGYLQKDEVVNVIRAQDIP